MYLEERIDKMKETITDLQKEIIASCVDRFSL